MANLSKKWGTVIGCWCVALVLIVTGICLGLVIPSSAAEENYEGDIAVMFDANGDGEISEDETTIYHTMDAVEEAVNALATTADNQVTIKLLSNIRLTGVKFAGQYCILDLNGNVCYIESQIYIKGGSCKITDSRPEVVRYFAYVGDGKYEYRNENVVGFNSPVYGGVIMADPSLFTIVATGGEDDGVDYGEAQLILDRGTYVGDVCGIWGMLATIVINRDVNLQFTTTNEQIGEPGLVPEGSYSIMAQEECEVEINGGQICGKVLTALLDEDGNVTVFNDIDLTDVPADSCVKINPDIKFIETTDANGMKIYTAVDAENKPITTPTEPIKDANQPANTTNNMIGIIVLGAATVVMIAGVGTAIGIAVKRRKRKVA